MVLENHNFSFGSVLRTFRTRRQLTQQQLAAQLGVRRNTIGSWERGDFLPQSRGVVLELARHLHLDEQEALLLLEASLTALTPSFLIPFPRNPYFTGREEILEALHERLSVEQAVAFPQSFALHGLGGVGKTQIALEYAYRHALEYSAVFWIGAETDEQIVTDFLRIAEVLQLPGREDKDQQRVVAAVQRWLTMHGQWLLIWDNVEDLDLLQRFLPSTRSGAMLLTTRRQTLGALAQGLDLAPMKQEEGMLFLLRRAKVVSPQASSEQVQQLAVNRPGEFAVALELMTVLGGLPLALDQAGAYLEATHCGLPAYLELLRTQSAPLLQLRGEGARDHPKSVSTTLQLAITRAASRHPALLDLLRVCAFMQADAIPEELFRQEGEHLGTELSTVARSDLKWNQLMASACGYSLLSRQPEEQTLSIHRLVQAVLLDTMADEERERWSTRVMAALDAALPEVWHTTEYATWKQCERLLPHVLLNVQRAGAASEALLLASLIHKAARYLLQRGRYTEAKPLLQQALQVREQAQGPWHPEVAASLNGLAILLLNQNKLAEAEPLLQRALQVREQAQGPWHPEVAVLLNNLAFLCQIRGKYTEAEPLYQRALQIWEQDQGPQHPQVAHLLNNLAELHWRQGKYARAKLFAQRALQIREQVLEPGHLQVAGSLSVLANLSREQGEYSEAERLYQRALQIHEQAQTLELPKGALLLNDLADCYRMQRRDVEAERLYQRALQIHEQALGPEHPNVADSLSGLANLALDRGHYSEAEQLYQRTLALREQNLGPDHPDTAHTLHDLALLRQEQGNLSEALSLAQRALSIRSRILGDSHPHTVATRELYAHLLQERARSGVEATSERRPEALPDPQGRESHAATASPSLHEIITPAPREKGPLQEFLDVCCERHPRAWCRSADIWDAYIRWAAEHQEPYPLSRGAFIVQLKAHGCRASRTMSARIWRGVTLVKKEA